MGPTGILKKFNKIKKEQKKKQEKQNPKAMMMLKLEVLVFVGEKVGTRALPFLFAVLFFYSFLENFFIVFRKSKPKLLLLICILP